MTNFSTNTLHQPIEVHDPSFTDQALPFCTLCIEIDARFIRFCIVENTSRQCKWVASYPFDSIQDVQDLQLALQQRIEEHLIFSKKTWGSIIVSFHSEVFTYVPAPLFNSAERHKYLSLMIPQHVFAPTTLFEDHLRIIDAYVVYVAPPTIIHWLKTYYSSQTVRFCHYTEPMIYHTITENYATIDQARMSVLVNQGQVTIVVVTGTQLRFCNTFIFQTAQELTYYVLAVVEQLALSQETTAITLHGDVSDQDAVHHELARFLTKIEIGRKPQSLTYPTQLNDFETQWYSSLFQTYFMVF